MLLTAAVRVVNLGVTSGVDELLYSAVLYYA